jgi:hypothetical protein
LKTAVAGVAGRVAVAPNPVPEQVLDVAATAQLLSAELTPDVAPPEYTRTKPVAAYAVLGTLLVVYLISLIVRRPDQQWPWLDGWTVTAFEFVASAICIFKGLQKRPGRLVPLILGCSLMSWTLGDFFLTFESWAERPPPTPSTADVFYLLFYPLAYVATVLLLQHGLGRLSRPNWLDGLVAGLGAAALCAAFAFHSIMHLTGGSDLATATNMAYPVGDLLMLLLVIGGTVLLSGRGTGQWYLLATGLSVIVIGDTFNLFSSSAIVSRYGNFGNDFNAIAWPTAVLLMSMSVWLPARSSDPLTSAKGLRILPAGSGRGLRTLHPGGRHPATTSAAWRCGWPSPPCSPWAFAWRISARSLRILTEERHRQAHTDELTSLGNRRQLFHILDLFFSDQVGLPNRARWPSSSSTSITSRRSTTPLATRPATNCCASWARAS